jgi:hypothetical protein
MDGIKEAPMAGSESQSARKEDTQGKEDGLFGRLKKAIFG